MKLGSLISGLKENPKLKILGGEEVPYFIKVKNSQESFIKDLISLCIHELNGRYSVKNHALAQSCIAAGNICSLDSVFLNEKIKKYYNSIIIPGEMDITDHMDIRKEEILRKTAEHYAQATDMQKKQVKRIIKYAPEQMAEVYRNIVAPCLRIKI